MKRAAWCLALLMLQGCSTGAPDPLPADDGDGGSGSATGATTGAGTGSTTGTTTGTATGSSTGGTTGSPPPADTAPVAHAGAAQVVDENLAVVLNGSASSDADGDPLSYAWTQTGGPAVTLSGADGAAPQFTSPEVADDSTLDFQLTVSDGRGGSSSDLTHVTVKHYAANLSQYMVPLTGTMPPGFVNPGPFAPFGLVHVGPDSEGPLNYGGYSYQNTLISGFSHVHMSAGVYKGGEIPFMPLTGNVTPGDLSSTGWPSEVPAYASPFTHVLESASAGYYSVTLLRYGVQAELTATPRAAMHRYTYQLPGQTPRLLIDVSRDLRGHHTASATMHGDGTLTGSVTTDDVGGYTVYFAAKFSAPYTAQTLDGTALAADQAVGGDTLGVLLDFPSLGGPLVSKIGLSYVDEAGALRNLDAEIPGWDFDAVHAQAVSTWDHQLAKLAVTGGSAQQLQSFYTALARALEFPNLFSDVDGRYAGAEDTSVIHSDTRAHYSEYSLWDSYRGQNALIAELEPGIYGDMVNSLLDFARQHGRLPRWQQAQRDAGHMSGDPAIPFIGEAWCRGASEAATRDELYAGMVALTQARAAEIASGYKPVDPPANVFAQLTGGPGGTGTTLEYGIADFSLALMAHASAHDNDAAAFTQRSLNYRNLIDPDGSGLVRPRLADGSWITPFITTEPYGFQEGTSWQYSWLAMHDIAGLVERMGGAAAVTQKLDTLFSFPANAVPLAVPLLQDQI
ncbi:MAG TPA: GH92 family glycosyl hydrolase, partial [Nevskiaceae bacterium]|nr:GH92 family glycosyl hydrolase [Nevskiaceae bacterium]